MWLIAGLGNPGASYARHRHNAGFMLLDALAHHYVASPWRDKFNGSLSEATIGSTRCLLLKPATFMNLSGQSLQPALQFYKIPPQQMLVLHDDLDLKLTQLRMKQGGGHGGHNGLRDIDARLGREYWRLRVGIGHPGDAARVHGHVLSDFTAQEQLLFRDVCAAVCAHMPVFFSHSAAAMMSKCAEALRHAAPDTAP